MSSPPTLGIPQQTPLPLPDFSRKKRNAERKKNLFTESHPAVNKSPREPHPNPQTTVLEEILGKVSGAGAKQGSGQADAAAPGLWEDGVRAGVGTELPGASEQGP